MSSTAIPDLYAQAKRLTDLYNQRAAENHALWRWRGENPGIPCDTAGCPRPREWVLLRGGDAHILGRACSVHVDRERVGPAVGPF